MHFYHLFWSKHIIVKVLFLETSLPRTSWRSEAIPWNSSRWICGLLFGSIPSITHTYIQAHGNLQARTNFSTILQCWIKVVIQFSWSHNFICINYYYYYYYLCHCCNFFSTSVTKPVACIWLVPYLQTSERKNWFIYIMNIIICDVFWCLCLYIAQKGSLGFSISA